MSHEILVKISRTAIILFREFTSYHLSREISLSLSFFLPSTSSAPTFLLFFPFRYHLSFPLSIPRRSFHLIDYSLNFNFQIRSKELFRALLLLPPPLLLSVPRHDIRDVKTELKTLSLNFKHSKCFIHQHLFIISKYQTVPKGNATLS